MPIASMTKRPTRSHLWATEMYMEMWFGTSISVSRWERTSGCILACLEVPWRFQKGQRQWSRTEPRCATATGEREKSAYWPIMEHWMYQREGHSIISTGLTAAARYSPGISARSIWRRELHFLIPLCWKIRGRSMPTEPYAAFRSILTAIRTMVWFRMKGRSTDWWI